MSSVGLASFSTLEMGVAVAAVLERYERNAPIKRAITAASNKWCSLNGPFLMGFLRAGYGPRALPRRF